MPKKYCVYILLLLGQGLYSLYGGEYFPFSTYNTFSKYRKIESQKYYRLKPAPDKPYHKEGILFEQTEVVNHLLNQLNILPNELSDFMPYKIYAIDEFVLGNYRDGTLYKKRRVYQKDDV